MPERHKRFPDERSDTIVAAAVAGSRVSGRSRDDVVPRATIVRFSNGFVWTKKNEERPPETGGVSSTPLPAVVSRFPVPCRLKQCFSTWRAVKYLSRLKYFRLFSFIITDHMINRCSSNTYFIVVNVR